MSRRSSGVLALVLGAIVGIVYPFIQLAVDCRAPQSEACVWGKALLPVSLAVSTVAVGAIAAAAIFAVLEWHRRAKEGRDETGDG
jgi:hypothetical protein